MSDEKKVIVYGASDDLIEVEGSLCEEFSAYDSADSKPRFLAFSDGTVLGVIYDSEGMWRINRIAKGSAQYTKTEATDADENHSDRVTLLGDLRWVVFGKEFHREPSPRKEQCR